MSYEFTKLSGVPAVAEFPEGANAIIETNGEIKRCPSSNTPKPLTYDYMPEGYPSKSVQTTTLMEEQELTFALMGDAGQYAANLTEAFEIVEGQTYTVSWDGTVYECVCSVLDSMLAFGNLSIAGAGNDTGEPFVYGYSTKQATGVFGTHDTSASHTISVKTTAETITPMAEEFLPNIPADKLPAGGVATLHINVTAVNRETMEVTFTADKTPVEMQQAAVNGPVWCVVSFAAGIMTEEAVSVGFPPAWIGDIAFGLVVERVHADNGNNNIVAAVTRRTNDTWTVDLNAIGS